MEHDKYQATKAKEIAEKKLKDMDFSGAKKFVLKAHGLYPDLDGLPQFLDTIEVYIRAEKRINGEVDWYNILGVEPAADEITIRRHYKKQAFALHPDRNKSVGADGAFKLISQAWSLLSDADSRSAHDRKRKLRSMDRQMQNRTNFAPAGQNQFGNNQFADIFTNENHMGASYPTPAATIHVQPKPSFWTLCHNCNTHFEYQIKHYLQKICCSYCQKPFFTFEVPPPTHFHNNASSASRIPHPQHRKFTSSYIGGQPYAPGKMAAAAIKHSIKECKPGVFSSDGGKNNISSASRMSRQRHWMFNSSWREMESSPLGRTPPTAVNPSQKHSNSGVFSMLDRGNANAATFTAQFSNAVPSASNHLKRGYDDTVPSLNRDKCHLGISHATNRTVIDPCADSYVSTSNSTGKVGRPQKIMRLGETRIQSDGEETETEVAGRNGVSLASGCGSKKGNVETARTNFPRIPKRNCVKNLSQEKVKSMLMAKARNEINKKLNEYSAASLLRTLRESNNNKQGQEMDKEGTESALNKARTNVKQSQDRLDSKRVDPAQDPSTAIKCSDPIMMNVPDPDFHDFDKDRTEKSFGDSQVWAAYDDDDGMPRYYAVIHGVVSLKPFKMKISWLNPNVNEKLASLKWTASGFPKTSGEFRFGKPEFNGLLNSFSHRVRWTKGLKGAILIYPKKGDVWALYRNWSPDWNVLTPDEVIHEYDMVEVVEDYNGEQSVNVAPLLKVPGFKTIFLRDSDPVKMMTIPKEELFRFSHQVPSYLLSGQEGRDIPEGSLELDPAATPMELLQILPKTQKDELVLTAGAAAEDSLKVVGEKDEWCQNCQRTAENVCLEDTATKLMAETMARNEPKEKKLLVYRRQRFRKQKMLERT